jgi:hypothetical protein
LPIDSAIGLATHYCKARSKSIASSKSRIRFGVRRSLAQERREGLRDLVFPVLRDVRWIAPLLPIPAFGLDDAASRPCVVSHPRRRVLAVHAEIHHLFRQPGSAAG